MSTKYRYTRTETMSLDDYHEFSSNFNNENGEWLAEAAAKDYHYHHDGWESSWPLTLMLQNADGTLIGTYEVDREVVPEFHATEVN